MSTPSKEFTTPRKTAKTNEDGENSDRVTLPLSSADEFMAPRVDIIVKLMSPAIVNTSRNNVKYISVPVQDVCSSFHFHSLHVQILIAECTSRLTAFEDDAERVQAQADMEHALILRDVKWSVPAEKYKETTKSTCPVEFRVDRLTTIVVGEYLLPIPAQFAAGTVFPEYLITYLKPFQSSSRVSLSEVIARTTVHKNVQLRVTVVKVSLFFPNTGM